MFCSYSISLSTEESQSLDAQGVGKTNIIIDYSNEIVSSGCAGDIAFSRLSLS